MGLAGILIGPFAAAIGIVAVFFVMRHRSVQTKSMYSARRGQIERKVRAARQRTLAPSSKRTEKEDAAAAAAEQAFVGPGMEAKTAVPTATWGPPAGLPAVAPAPQFPPQQPQQQPVWEVGPTVPPPPSAPIPSPPAPPPYEPAYQAPPPPPRAEARRGRLSETARTLPRKPHRTRKPRRTSGSPRWLPGSSLPAGCPETRPTRRSRGQVRRSRSRSTRCSSLDWSWC